MGRAPWKRAGVEVREFERLLHIGLGRAILFLKEHDATPYRDAILHACLHDVGFDRQIEPSRAQYLWEIAQLTGEEAYYREQIIRAFQEAEPEPEPSDDNYDREQLFELLVVLALQGDEEARRLAYEKFAENAARDGDETGAYGLVKLDGLNAFLFIADQLVAKAMAEGEEWLPYFLLRYVEDEFGEAETWAALEEASTKNPRIAMLMRWEREARREEAARTAKHKKTDPTALTYEEVMQLGMGQVDFSRLRYDQLRQYIIDRAKTGQRFWGFFKRWGLHADDDTILQAAQDLLAEENQGRLIAYLNIFRARQFPLDYSRLLELAQSSNDDVASWALEALEPISNPLVRELALRLLEAGQHRVGAVGLFVNNYEDDDFKIVEQAIEAEQDENVIHGIGYGLREMAKKHATSDAAGALISFYQKGPCSPCREKAVDLMLWLDVLPEWVREECHHDANFDIRALVEQEE